MPHWVRKPMETFYAKVAGAAPETLMQAVTRDKDYRAWTKEFLS